MATTTLKQQVQLASGTRRLTTWVDADKRLHAGATMTLKDYAEPQRVWDILHVGTPHVATDIKRGWNNNI
jgi:hypothetical protein